MKHNSNIRTVDAFPAAIVALMAGLITFSLFVGFLELFEGGDFYSVLVLIITFPIYGLIIAPIVIPLYFVVFISLKTLKILNSISMSLSGIIFGALIAYLVTTSESLGLSSITSIFVGSISGALAGYVSFKILKNCEKNDREVIVSHS